MGVSECTETERVCVRVCERALVFELLYVSTCVPQFVSPYLLSSVCSITSNWPMPTLIPNLDEQSTEHGVSSGRIPSGSVDCSITQREEH